MADIRIAHERQVEDNLSKDCVTYFCPGHLNTFKDRSLNLSSKTITYLTFSPDGTELLVNMGSEQIYLYDLNNAQEPVVRNVASVFVIIDRLTLNLNNFFFSI